MLFESQSSIQGHSQVFWVIRVIQFLTSPFNLQIMFSLPIFDMKCEYLRFTGVWFEIDVFVIFGELCKSRIDFFLHFLKSIFLRSHYCFVDLDEYLGVGAA